MRRLSVVVFPVSHEIYEVMLEPLGIRMTITNPNEDPWSREVLQLLAKYVGNGLMGCFSRNTILKFELDPMTSSALISELSELLGDLNPFLAKKLLESYVHSEGVN